MREIGWWINLVEIEIRENKFRRKETLVKSPCLLDMMGWRKTLESPRSQSPPNARKTAGFSDRSIPRIYREGDVPRFGSLREKRTRHVMRCQRSGSPGLSFSLPYFRACTSDLSNAKGLSLARPLLYFRVMIELGQKKNIFFSLNTTIDYQLNAN